MKEETKNRIRRIFGMQEYCPECGMEIPFLNLGPSGDAWMLESGEYERCSTCGGVKKKVNGQEDE